MHPIRSVRWCAILSALCVLAPAAPSAGQTPAAVPAPPRVGDTLARLRKTPRDPLLLDRLREGLMAEPADPEAARGLAVYALGCVWMEKLEEAEAARKALRSRFPDSPEARTLAEWDGLFRPCPWCHGTGRRPAATCERCKGSRKCPACGGDGTVTLMGNRKAPCPACNGTGRCPACGGTGRGEEACVRCGGAGRIPAPDPAFRLYRAVLRAEGE